MKQAANIHVVDTDEGFSCKGDESVLRALERCGRKGIPSGCRSGGCGVCKIRILEGSYSCKKMSRAHVTEHEEEAGYALACRCYPQGDVIVKVVGQMKNNGFKSKSDA